MRQPERLRPTLFLALAALPIMAGSALGGDGLESTATESVMVQSSGPRTGDSGKTYANVQGQEAGSDPRFAGFAILDFPAAKSSAKARPKSLNLTLTQSVARFTRDGKIKFYLAAESAAGLEATARRLKFDPKQPGGVGDQMGKLVPLGAADFAKGGSGDADVYPLPLDDAARKVVEDRLRAGGTIRVVIVPEDLHVAATFFGVGAREAENRPKLTIETVP